MSEHGAPLRVAPARSGAVEPARPRIERPRIALPSAVTLIVAALWIAGALLGMLRIALGYVALAKLQRDALPLPPAYRDDMPLWEQSTHRGGRETRLCVSSNVAVPVAVGLFDGMILMPNHLLASFDHADVDRFSLHEMAHLQRRDDWTCAFERIACALLFFNPAVRWIARQLDLEREVACDDWVVSQTREVRPYAVGLTKMAEATPWPHRPVPAPAIFASRKSISIRIERLLNKHRDVRPTVARGPAAACGIAMLAVSLVLLPVAPVIGNVVTPAVPAAATHAATAAQPRTAATAKKPPAHAAPKLAANAPADKAPRQARTTARTTAPAMPPHAASVAAVKTPSAGKPRTVALAAVQPPQPVPPAAAHAKHAVTRSTWSMTFSDAPKPARKQSEYHFSYTSADSSAAGSSSSAASLSSSRGASSSASTVSAAGARVDLLDALSTSGYGKLSADDIIALHDNGVGGALVIAAAKYFDRRATVKDIVELARSGVSSKYLDDLGRAGVRATPADVVAFLQSGVSAAYASALQHAVTSMSAASIVELAHHGVSSRLVVGLKERGYDANVAAIVEFAAHGVPLSYVDALNTHRNPKFTLDEIVKLHDRGVNADAL